MPDIYSYTDYRLFLGDYFSQEKSRNHAFSHQYFARKANIKSSGFVLHVIKRERNITRPVLLNIARAIGLSGPETEYFEDLMAFDQAKTQSDREHYFARIAAKRKHVKATSLDDRQYEMYSSWYNPVIRELVTLAKNNHEPAAIAKNLIPSITLKQAKTSLKLMEELGLLQKNKNGNYQQAQKFLSAGGPVRNTALVKYQKEMLHHAVESWDRFSQNELAMHTVTLCMSEALFSTIKEEVRAFKNRILELAEQEKVKPERIYHLNINMFPVTKTIKGENL
jgi:uncharacterized protein (TIGR02147 family)